IERNAVILAHNYQIPAIQDVADFIGDSLGLSLQAQATDAETIVFCGVHFMAETAAVLCPDKTVLIPDLEAGCSLASTITASQLRTWKEEHPGAAVVVYVNCSADVKAEADYCCTSANALRIVESIPADREILFAPDMFLGEYIREKTERTIHVWMGECHVHAAIRPADVEKQLAEHPDAELLIHPECGCVSNVMWQLSKGDLPADRTRITSTTGMIESIESSPASEFLVATETGILHQMKKRHPKRTFLPVKADAECMYMKMITLEKLAKALREGIHEVRVPKETASRARLAIERMVSIH
ncbi:MAG: quinolinate synthase NadA, partial [Pseudomonadales bacterium]|nr:quinolinate synthase NadA [Pseudomonadales bacterium]